jgi:hypothetical protein
VGEGKSGEGRTIEEGLWSMRKRHGGELIIRERGEQE